MLTIKQITENTEAVLRGLEKKHFKNAQETIEQVLAFNDKRKSTQNVLDKNLAEVNAISKSIGMLMKEGKKDEAEAAKARVAEIKEANKTLQAEMDKAQEDLNNLLYTEVEVNQVVLLCQIPVRKSVFWQFCFHTTGLFHYIVFC